MKHIFLTAIVAALVALGVGKFFPASVSGMAVPAPKETAYERVMRTGVLRCGYQLYPPYAMKDVTSGQHYGIYPDFFKELGIQTNLTIEWTEELGSDQMFTALASGRVDALCTPVTATPERARVADFTQPIGFVPFYVYVKAGVDRFDGHPERLNDSNVSFMVKDGDLIEILARQFFPKATRHSLPGLADAGQFYLSVTTGKADALIGEPVFASEFMRHNPGKLKRVDIPPLKVIAANVAIPLGDSKMKSFMENSIQSMLAEGVVESLLERYISDSSAILLPAKSYREQN